jgi:PTS system nitrogen regulatory IIA component
MDHDIPLSTLVERGGIFYEVAGESVDTVLAEFIEILPCPFFPDSGGQDYRNCQEFKAALLKAALEREALMSTGIGRGIALPHPRNPMASGAAAQFVAIGFPALPVDWKAIDGGPVHSVLLIVSASPQSHLRTLSKINFLCADSTFLSLLKTRPAPDMIIGTIREVERGWN